MELYPLPENKNLVWVIEDSQQIEEKIELQPGTFFLTPHKDLSEMKSTKVFSVFCCIKLLSWNLLFIWFLPPHETVKTE